MSSRLLCRHANHTSDRVIAAWMLSLSFTICDTVFKVKNARSLLLHGQSYCLSPPVVCFGFFPACQLHSRCGCTCIDLRHIP